jgi:predicted metal-dependent hydrolase
MRRNYAHYQAHKEQARAFIMERIAEYNAHLQLSIGRVSIKNQKTCWGSCSRKGNLNFNYALVHLPIQIADYVIVHELCHLVHFNHSRAFWDLVARIVPEYLQFRAQLKRYQLGHGAPLL